MNQLCRLEVAVYPIGTADSDISEHVSRVMEILDRADLPYQVTTMNTIVEGPLDQLFALARNLHDSVFSDRVGRVVTIMKIDDRRTP